MRRTPFKLNSDERVEFNESDVVVAAEDSSAKRRKSKHTNSSPRNIIIINPELEEGIIIATMTEL